MVNATLYLLHYNNYYNRQVKRESTSSAYYQYLVKANGSYTDSNGNTNTPTGINFIPNDGVNTEQVVNWEGDSPDYVVVLDEDQNINSRWFVVSSIRVRAGQIKLELYRDTLADFYEEISNAPVFVEKATLKSDNPLIFNTEDITFNQIKKKEILLKDKSKCPWVVLYTDQKTKMSSVIDPKEGNIAVTYSSPGAFYNSNIYQAFNQENHFIGSPSTIQYERWVLYLQCYNSVYYLAPIYDFNTDSMSYMGSLSANTNPNYLQTNVNRNDGFTESQILNMVRPAVSTIKAGPTNLINDLKKTGYYVDEATYNDATALANQIVKVAQTNGGYKYYKIVCTPTTSERVYFNITDQNVWNIVKNAGISQGTLQSEQPTTPFAQIYLSVAGYKVDIQETSVDELKVDILPMNFTKDAPYNVLCMPFSDNLKVINSKNSTFKSYTANKSVALNVAKRLILDYAGAGALYDAQILPYCPLASSVITEDGELDINSSTADTFTPIQNSTGNVEAYIYRCDLSSFNRKIDLEEPIVINNTKIESQTDLYRLCSPNFNGLFEFNAAKNKGVSYIVASCTYKPYSPYIKVRPDFKGLYGTDFDDSRGLILGGDFSLPMTTDAWKTYELQNKNYQASFDRQILSMETQNNILRQQEKVKAITSTVGAGVQGGMAGGMAGSLAGPIGMSVGAGVGMVGGIAASAYGAYKDIQFNEDLRREAMSMTKDQFGYTLGNIKALPQSLSKTTAYNIDNKYFPFLEYYSCTKEEKIALANKIVYNGMTVGVIGKMSDYINNTWSYTLTEDEETYGPFVAKNYFKGKLIRLESINEDFHVINAIANELYQGVYI